MKRKKKKEILSKDWNKEETMAMRNFQQYKFEIRQGPITHMHHNIQFSPDF